MAAEHPRTTGANCSRRRARKCLYRTICTTAKNTTCKSPAIPAARVIRRVEPNSWFRRAAAGQKDRRTSFNSRFMSVRGLSIAEVGKTTHKSHGRRAGDENMGRYGKSQNPVKALHN